MSNARVATGLALGRSEIILIVLVGLVSLLVPALIVVGIFLALRTRRRETREVEQIQNQTR